MSQTIKTVSFNGIMRNTSPEQSTPGGCEELINVRRLHGSNRPVGKKDFVSDISRTIEGLPAYDSIKVWKHSVLPDGQWLKVDLYAGIIKISDLEDGGYNITVLSLLSGEIITDGAALGNWFVFTTNKRHIRLLWNGTEYTFEDEIPYTPSFELSGVDPELGSGDFIAGGEAFNKSNATTGTTRKVDGKVIFDNVSFDDVMSFYNSSRMSDRNAHYIPDDLILRIAIELKDGSYILQSEPIYAGRNNTGLVYLFGSYLSGGYSGNIKVSINDIHSDGLFVQFDATDVAYLIANNSESIKNVILASSKAINVFDNYVTEEDEGELIEIGTETFDSTVFTKYKYEHPDFNKEDIFDDGNYFIVKRWELEELPTDDVEQIEIDWSIISSNEILSIDSTRYRDKLLKGNVFTYNKRIHLDNYQRSLAALEISTFFAIIETTTPYSYHYEVKLKENNEQYRIVEEIGEGESLSLQGFIFSYPHAGAYELNIYRTDGVTVERMYSMGMKAHPNLNYSYYSKFDEDSNTFIQPSENIVTVSDIPSNSNIVTYDNQIAVSNFNNPELYESGHTYDFGDGEVVGMDVPTFALSQGQFGFFPLFVFTTKGLWALQQGSDDVLYSTQTPVSKDVALSRQGISGSEIGVFFTTKEGLMVVGSSQPDLLSKIIERKPSRSLITVRDYNLFNGKDLGDIDPGDLYLQFPTIDAYLCEDSFKVYVQNAVIAHITTDDTSELIISNPDYDYSFVFNLESKSYYKITQSFKSFINDHPIIYGLTPDEMIYDLSKEDNASDITVLMESSPIIFNSQGFKNVQRTVLRGFLKISDKILTLAVYLSNDCRKWEIFDIAQYDSSGESNEFEDLYLNTTLNAAKYIKFVVSGKLSPESYINGVDVVVSEERGTKLV